MRARSRYALTRERQKESPPTDRRDQWFATKELFSRVLSMIANAENLVGMKRVTGLVLFAVMLVAAHAGTAFASGGSACVLTNAQATRILGSTASHGSPDPAKGCIYASSSSRVTIDIDRYSPVPKLLSVRELKELTMPTSITPLHGIRGGAYLIKAKATGIKVVSVCFDAGDSLYLVNLDASNWVPGKQIMRLEAAVMVAAKKL